MAHSLLSGKPKPPSASDLVSSSQAYADRAFLEVVAERPVAQHLEERGVPGGLAHLVDVQGPDALLHVGGPLVGRRSLAEQVGLERLHARDDEEHRGVVGNQGGRGHDGVPLLLEVRKEAAGDLCRLHQWPSSGSASWSVERVRSLRG